LDFLISSSLLISLSLPRGKYPQPDAILPRAWRLLTVDSIVTRFLPPRPAINHI
jgi:hypothetical protein